MPHQWSRALRLTILSLVVAVTQASPHAAYGLPYSFEMIATTGSQFDAFGFLSSAPGISNNGTVVFTASTDSLLTAGLFAGNGRSIDALLAPAYSPILTDGVSFSVSDRGAVLFISAV